MAKFNKGEIVCYNGTDFAIVLIEGGHEGRSYLLEEEIGGSGEKLHNIREDELHHLTYAQRLARIEEALGLD